MSAIFGYDGGMDTAQASERSPTSQDSEHIAREVAGIEAAEREIADGLYLEFNDVRAWVQSLGTEHELLLPPVRHR